MEHASNFYAQSGTKFSLRLHRVTSVLADMCVRDDKNRSEFEDKTRKLNDSAMALDYAMRQVFPTNTPYVTSVFVQLQAPRTRCQPALTDQVLHSFPLLFCFFT